MSLSVKDFKVGDFVQVRENAWRSNPEGLKGKVKRVGHHVLELEGEAITPYLDGDEEFLVYPSEVEKIEEPLADWEKELLAATITPAGKTFGDLPTPAPTLRSRILEAANKLADTLEKVDEKHIEQGVVNVGPDPWTRDTVAVTFTAQVRG